MDDVFSARCPLCHHVFPTDAAPASGMQMWGARCPVCGSDLLCRLEMDGEHLVAFDVIPRSDADDDELAAAGISEP